MKTTVIIKFRINCKKIPVTVQVTGIFSIVVMIMHVIFADFSRSNGLIVVEKSTHISRNINLFKKVAP